MTRRLARLGNSAPDETVGERLSLGERKLLCSIIEQAVSDLRIDPGRLQRGLRALERGRTGDPSVEAVRNYQSAVWFLFDDDRGFPMIAGSLGLDVEEIRRALK